jgi:hypothetical protein
VKLEWNQVTIPDSSPSVTVARLRGEPDGASWVLVRFPPGWARLVSGHYLAAEEYWLLEGELVLNGVTHRLGECDRVPAGAVRTDTRTPLGALIIARFSAPARWFRENDPDPRMA